ncbi:MAG TPA: succinate dehydrogenase, partial [Nitrospirota bacterium]
MRLSDNLFFRRLHSLTGAVPLGAFLVFHLYANSFSLSGPAAYDEHVRFLRSLPYLHVLEWGLIFLPLLYH